MQSASGRPHGPRRAGDRCIGLRIGADVGCSAGTRDPAATRKTGQGEAPAGTGLTSFGVSRQDGGRSDGLFAKRGTGGMCPPAGTSGQDGNGKTRHPEEAGRAPDRRCLDGALQVLVIRDRQGLVPRRRRGALRLPSGPQRHPHPNRERGHPVSAERHGLERVRTGSAPPASDLIRSIGLVWLFDSPGVLAMGASPLRCMTPGLWDAHPGRLRRIGPEDGRQATVRTLERPGGFGSVRIVRSGA